MRGYCLAHLSDASLLHALAALVARDRATTASLLAHLAEVDERRLYLPAGYPSMHAYCVGELHLSEDSAFKRIRAARAAHRVPVLFDAIASGELSLSTVNLLSPHLTDANAADLIAAATHRSRAEVEALLAARFPQSEFLGVGEITTLGGAIAPCALEDPAADLTTSQRAPGPVGTANSLPSHAPDRHPAPQSRLAPIAAERYLLHLPIDRATHDKLRHAAALLGHCVPSGDVAQVLDRALDALIARLERRKCAKSGRPAPRRGRSQDPRHIPAAVRRAVWERDGGRCTFVGDGGHRCEARTRLEFDHVEPVARGGTASVATIRLRCRAHNQYEAERTFGVGFMRARRAEARERAARRRDHPEARRAAPRPDTRQAARRDDIALALRTLGFRADEIRRGLEHAGPFEGASPEARLRAAL